jgi:hypothetical protein
MFRHLTQPFCGVAGNQYRYPYHYSTIEGVELLIRHAIIMGCLTGFKHLERGIISIF